MMKETVKNKMKGSPTYEKKVEKKVVVENKSKARPVTVTKTKKGMTGSGLGNTSYSTSYKRAT